MNVCTEVRTTRSVTSADHLAAQRLVQQSLSDIASISTPKIFGCLKIKLITLTYTAKFNRTAVGVKEMAFVETTM